MPSPVSAVHCPSASIPNALLLLFPKDLFFTHPFLAAGTLTVTHSDAPRGKTNLATQPYQHDYCTNILPQNFWRPSFIQEKQVARSQLATLSPSLPPIVSSRKPRALLPNTSSHHSRLAAFVRLGRRWHLIRILLF